MIDGFKCRETDRLWHEQSSRRLPQKIQQKALDKLQLLDAVVTLDDLRVPPGGMNWNMGNKRTGNMGYTFHT